MGADHAPQGWVAQSRGCYEPGLGIKHLDPVGRMTEHHSRLRHLQGLIKQLEDSDGDEFLFPPKGMLQGVELGCIQGCMEKRQEAAFVKPRVLQEGLENPGIRDFPYETP